MTLTVSFLGKQIELNEVAGDFRVEFSDGRWLRITSLGLMWYTTFLLSPGSRLEAFGDSAQAATDAVAQLIKKHLQELEAYFPAV